MITAERAQTKSETVQSDIVGYYPRSKLPFRGILSVELDLRVKASILVIKTSFSSIFEPQISWYHIKLV